LSLDTRNKNLADKRVRHRTRWKPFVMGMTVMLVVSTSAVWGWQVLHHPDPVETQLAASLSPLPVVLSAEQLETVRQQLPLVADLPARTQQQLTYLSQLAPDWRIDYSRQLVGQAQALLPEQTRSLAQQWQQQLHTSALPIEAMSNWHQGMMKLQQLGDRLSQLDEKRGKYLTVSELKSVIYSTSQTFNRVLPVEELLRRYADNPSDIQLRQVEMALEQLQKRYYLLRQASIEKQETSLIKR